MLWLAFSVPCSIWSQVTGTVQVHGSAVNEAQTSRAGATLPAQTKPARAADEKAVPLTQVVQVRGLSQEVARGGVPVKLKGIVTDLSGYHNSFFLQDSTAGISIDRAEKAEVRVGDRVEVTGTSGAGLFAPTVLSSNVAVIGHGPPPAARRFGYGDLMEGAQDSQWVEVQGVVHSAKISDLFGREVLSLSLEMGGGSVNVLLQDFAGIDYDRLVDTMLRVRGVCTTSFNEKRQFVGLGMIVPDRADVDVVLPAPRDPFAIAAIPVRNVLQFGQGQHRVKVAGIATYQIPGRALYLQEGSDGIRIQTTSKDSAAPGDRVEAVGFPVMGEYAPILKDSFFRVVGHAAPVAPLRIDAKNAITQVMAFNHVPYDAQLVQLQGQVVESRVQAGQQVWIMRQGDGLFEAYLPMAAGGNWTREISAGSILLLTGVVSVQTDPDRNPVSFDILLRSRQDLAVLKKSPWWTPVRVLWLLAVFAAGIVLTILWVVMLRDRVRQQTRTIRESEEQFRYLAMHDGLTGLLNRGAILASLDGEIDRYRREDITLTVILADIDNFKRVNDTYGHLAGDEAVRRFGEALSGCVRSYDHAGRYGGEEFLIVLSGIRAEELASRLAELHGHISNLTVRDRETEFNITCTLGAIFLEPGQDIDRHLVLQQADQALYRAKEDGRARVEYGFLKRETVAKG